MEADTNMHPILRGSRRIWQWNQSIADHEEEAFTNLKPKDAAIVGMYQQFGDQAAENAAIIREVGSRG
jgi:hypothetical protein